MAAKREHHIKVVCPCCGQQRRIRDTPLLAAEETLRQCAVADYYGKGWAVKSAQLRSLQWACKGCLRDGRAIEAKPWLQSFGGYSGPCLAYFDTHLRCDDCHEDFVFSAKEQQFWYERLRFWMQSRPKQCPKCRRRRRALRRPQQLIQAELAQLDPNNPEQLLRLAALYYRNGSHRKAAEFLGRAKNQARKRGQLDAFTKQIEEWRNRMEFDAPKGEG